MNDFLVIFSDNELARPVYQYNRCADSKVGRYDNSKIVLVSIVV